MVRGRGPYSSDAGSLSARRNSNGSYGVWFNGGNWFGIYGYDADGNRTNFANFHTAKSYTGWFELILAVTGNTITVFANGERIQQAVDTKRLVLGPGGVAPGVATIRPSSTDHSHFRQIEVLVPTKRQARIFATAKKLPRPATDR